MVASVLFIVMVVYYRRKLKNDVKNDQRMKTLASSFRSLQWPVSRLRCSLDQGAPISEAFRTGIERASLCNRNPNSGMLVTGDLGVLVSNVFGKNMEEFTYQDGSG